MKWLKRLMKNLSDNMEENEKLCAPMPDVKPTKKLILSEPIISFVECVRNNPGRFTTYYHYSFLNTHRRIKDKKTNQKWTLYSGKATDMYNEDNPEHKYVCLDAAWATQDELEYVDTEVARIMYARQRRLAEVKKIRHDKRMVSERERLVSERERLKGVYCS